MYLGASLGAQTVKNLPAMQQTQIRSLGQDGPLEKEMTTLSSILARKVSWTEELDGLWTIVHKVAKSQT